MDFDPRLAAYVTPGGDVARLAAVAAGAGEAPTVAVQSVTVGKVTTATVAASGPNAAVADLTNARWRVTPGAATYDRQTLFGASATWKHTASSAGQSSVTVYVPRLDGGPDVQVDVVVVYPTASVSGLFPKTVARVGGETLRVEASAGFATSRSRLPARLIRTRSPGAPVEAVIVDSRTVDFPAGTGVALSASVVFPAASGVGAGYEYFWEVEVAAGHVVRSTVLPVWVLGSDPSCAPQSLSKAPVSLDYPGVYTRAAADAKQVTPASGRTYAEHVAKFVYDWKANNLSAPVGGAWLSFDDYNANIYWVDLDDPNIPRYTFRHWDVWQQGYVPAGWYGTAADAQPFPRSQVATGIPVPNNAAPSIGTDRSLCIVGLRGGKVERIWEMWLAQKLGDGGWQAASIGVTTAADEWRHSRTYTVAAAGVSALAYALRVAEAKSAVEYVRARRAAGQAVSDAEILARVPHALSINQPNPYVGQFSYPATYSDGGSTDTATAWEGQLVYLRQDADIAGKNFTPLQHVIAVVGKWRGFRVTDRTSWSTTMIVEGDQAYGGGIWSTLREANESWKVIYPDDWFVIGRQYASKAAFDADTGSSGSTPGGGDTGTTTPPASTYVDAENVSFTNGSLTSKYHIYAAGQSSTSGLLVWLHGDDAYEFKNPSSTYVMGGTNGVKAVGKARGYIVANVLAPDTSGTITWWEAGSANAVWFAALLDALVSKYGVSRNKIILCGFSGGAQFITQYFVPQYANKISGGGSIVFGGGGKPVSPSSPTFSSAFKQGFWMNWTTGALDDAAHSDENYDALGYAKAGATWYQNAGFYVSTNWPAGKTHVLDGLFGGYVAGVLDAPPKPATAPATPSIGTSAWKEVALRVVSTAENATTDWTKAYTYIKDINDGRGYTGGIVGWCSATGDMLTLAQYANTIQSGNLLAKWISPLQQVMAVPYADRPAKSNAVLGSAFIADWKTAGAAGWFQTAQRDERDRVYWGPAYRQAVADGVGPLGLTILYDISVNHGPGTDAESFGGIVAAAAVTAKPPSQGGTEKAYLTALCDKRDAVLKGWGDFQANGRGNGLRYLLANNPNLNVPISWPMYGTTYTITSMPA